MCLCSSGTHTTLLCIFCVQKRDIVRDCGSGAEYLTASSRSRSKQPQVRCSIGAQANAGTCEERFFGGVCKFRTKNIFDFFCQPSHTRASANENILDGAACQSRGVGEVLELELN